MDCEGRPLEIRKAKQSDETVTTTISPNVMDTPNKVFIGGVPTYLNEEQVMELLKAFGELKSFQLIKDSVTGLSKGFAFCEYQDPDIIDLACQGLNGMEIGDKRLIVQRSTTKGTKAPEVPGLAAPIQSDIPLLPVDILGFIAENKAPPTRILMLLNMISDEDLRDDEDYQDILLDIQEECSKAGKIEKIIIPRPTEDAETLVPGVGKIFIEYATVEDCVTAQKSLAGRPYNDRAIITAYFDEEKFKKEQF
jgi:splicing factor U2AF subunit